MEKAKVNIAIIDENRLLREGLSYLLEENGEFQVKFKKGKQALRKKELFAQIDLLLLDINIYWEYKNQICLLKNETSSMKVIILVDEVDEEKVLDALVVGVDGILLKEMDTADFISGVRKVLNEVYYLHPAITTVLVNNYYELATESETDGRVAETHPLTKREYSVLEEIAKGHSIDEIGMLLGISVNTVQIHLSKLYTKLGVHSKTEAVVTAVRNNWVKI